MSVTGSHCCGVCNLYHTHIDMCISPVCCIVIIIYEEICCVSILFAFLCVHHFPYTKAAAYKSYIEYSVTLVVHYIAEALFCILLFKIYRSMCKISSNLLFVSHSFSKFAKNVLKTPHFS